MRDSFPHGPSRRQSSKEESGFSFLKKLSDGHGSGDKEETLKGAKGLFKGLEDSFNQIKNRPGWWGPTAGSAGSRSSHLSDFAGQRSSAKQAGRGGAAGPASPSSNMDNTAMTQHFVAIERLVRMGLSPYAAKAALNHLDDWVASHAGTVEMSAAEVAALSLGEPILHVGDVVRLQGMDSKNASSNGKLCTLQAYGAENQRWLVALHHDGKQYWIRPKYFEPIESRGPMSADESQIADASSDPAFTEACQRMLAQREDALRRKQESLEAKEIQVLEREERCHAREDSLKSFEEKLRRSHESVEAGQQLLGRQRQSFASEQARTLKELGEKEAALRASEGGGEAQAFSMAASDDLHRYHPPHPEDGELRLSRRSSSAKDSEGGGADEVWDMDWAELATQKLAAAGSSMRLGRTLSGSSASDDHGLGHSGSPNLTPAHSEALASLRHPGNDSAGTGSQAVPHLKHQVVAMDDEDDERHPDPVAVKTGGEDSVVSSEIAACA